MIKLMHGIESPHYIQLISTIFEDTGMVAFMIIASISLATFSLAIFLVEMLSTKRFHFDYSAKINPDTYLQFPKSEDGNES